MTRYSAYFWNLLPFNIFLPFSHSKNFKTTFCCLGEVSSSNYPKFTKISFLFIPHACSAFLKYALRYCLQMGKGVPSKKTDITCASVYNKKTKSHNSNNNKFDKRKMDMFTTRNYEWKTVGLIKIPIFFVGAKISHKL